MQKARRHTVVLRPLVSVWFQVLFTLLLAVLFTFPSRYLFAIGLSGVFSLTGWYRQLHTTFRWCRATQESAHDDQLTITGLSPSLVGLPSPFFFVSHALLAVLLPHINCSIWFGLFRVRSPLLTESFS